MSRRPAHVLAAGLLVAASAVAATDAAYGSLPVGERSNQQDVVSTVLYGAAPLAPDDVWVVGSARTDLREQIVLRHWDGARWREAHVPGLPQSDEAVLLDIAAVAPDDIWAVGLYYVGRERGRSLILHYDGTGWRVVPHPNGHTWTALASVAVVDADDVWAGGTVTQHYGSYYRPLFEHWDGHTWSVSLQRHPRRRDGGVEALSAVTGDDVWGITTQYLYHWDGKWASTQPITASGAPDIHMLSATDGWAVDGSHHLLHWDGSSWSPVTDDPDVHPAAVTGTSAEDVWAGGSTLEHWDGSTWTEYPGHPGTIIGLAARAPDDVWAVGYGGPRGLVEHWNGAEWTLVS